MKLLVDNQLPEALAAFLAANGLECRHVRRRGLGNARKTALLQAFAKVLPELRAGLENGIPVIEIGG